MKIDYTPSAAAAGDAAHLAAANPHPQYGTTTHVQNSASTAWVIAHGLNRFPAVNVVDSAGTEVVAHIDYDDANQITVRLANPSSGKAYLN